MLTPGDPAPDFTAVDDAGRLVRLADFRGRPVVLYFYPKDHTPGCTAEACHFRDRYADLEALGAVVLGVSPDLPATHRRFRQWHRLPFRLISDPDRRLAAAYGVRRDLPVIGRFVPLLDRVTFVIGPDGRVLDVLRGIPASRHAEKALEVLRAQLGR
ncbi:alkyl hydroperoxide reductase/ Thiol specific antioxidant/ Mal allergen [Thermaerobacter marianensis DSM 12885]|uniref:thioredoxin-dependent peroxiredoxin n=1 Tax=Thermaerobacter marianensis (strain ATCC 700841 / DSM 12885 / JCM 10246 / 7p75a) TaxID=644966 RepID=E6SIT7_THEM7|nr:peroxiredoxin [Thermaerobacter marianensis]ADU52031.1 alkyl hydroperoxide reductase/ Thiol specific antioxidant/ Mal allergen [Thermaerobacter marianensis DSM 12885]